MNWEAVGATGEVIGAIAVFATLIYLAIQIRQSTKATQSVAELEASKQLADFTRRIGTDPQMRRIWDEVADGKDLEDDDHSAYLWLMAEHIFISEGVFLQYQKGFLSHELWDEFERLMVGYLQHPIVLAWWRGGNSPFSQDFKDHVEKLTELEPSWKLPMLLRPDNELTPNKLSKRGVSGGAGFGTKLPPIGLKSRTENVGLVVKAARITLTALQPSDEIPDVFFTISR